MNICGEFYQATRLCADAARRFEKLGDAEHAARVWIEAAWAETYLGNLEAAEKYLERAQQHIFVLPTEEGWGVRVD